MISSWAAWRARSSRPCGRRRARVPADLEGFVAWFEDLKATGPSQNDPLFPWLAETADLEAMRRFLQQEVAGEAGFDDLAAMIQVKMPVQAKLKLARNYLDEMGRGVAFATSRRYAFHAIGALGVVELTAPWRADLIAKGLKRVGVGKERKDFALHATLDVTHSEAWNAEVLRPLVSANPDCARYIAEGALMRLEAGRRCFEAYRAHF
jgi:hypothetical protein